MDKLKLVSDDTYFNEEHIKYLLNKYRAAILKKILNEKLSKFTLSEANYQTLCLDLETTFAIDGVPCEGLYLRSVQKIPPLICMAEPRLYTGNYYKGDITLVSCDRMRFVGHNKWLKNIIYASVSPDRYLYLTSANPQFLYLEKIKMSVIVEDPEAAKDLLCCNDDSTCDPYDIDFPLEDAYIAPLIEQVVQSFSQNIYQPEDKTNNASDDYADYGDDAAKAAALKAAYKSLRSSSNSSDSSDD